MSVGESDQPSGTSSPQPEDASGTGRSPEAERVFAAAREQHEAGNLVEALAGYERAARLAPHDPVVFTHLGAALQAQGRTAAAIVALKRAVALDPEDAYAHAELGRTLQRAEKTREASIAFFRALELDPEDGEGHLGLGLVLKDLGFMAEAERSFDRAVAASDGAVIGEALKHRAALRLAAGELVAGLTDLVQAEGLPETASAHPDWDGSDPSGKTILVRAPDDIPDTVLLGRYCAVLQRMGAVVVVEASDALVPLCGHLAGVDLATARGEPLPPHDLQAGLRRLPIILGTTGESVQRDGPYLEVAAAGQGSGGDGRKRVGIAWATASNDGSGGRGSAAGSGAGVTLQALLPILERPELSFIALQKGEHEISELGLGGLVQASDTVADDLVGLAEVIAGVDLVIAVEGPAAHIAGALGRPVWVMAAHAPGWAWLPGSDGRAWYPTAQLFKQPAPGDWTSVVDGVREALAREAPAPRARAKSRPPSNLPPSGAATKSDAAAAVTGAAVPALVAPDAGGAEMALAMQAVASAADDEVSVEEMALFDPNAGGAEVALAIQAVASAADDEVSVEEMALFDPNAGGAEMTLAMQAVASAADNEVSVEEMALFDPNAGGAEVALAIQVVTAAADDEVSVEEMALFDPNAGGAEMTLAMQAVASAADDEVSVEEMALFDPNAGGAEVALAMQAVASAADDEVSVEEMALFDPNAGGAEMTPATQAPTTAASDEASVEEMALYDPNADGAEMPPPMQAATSVADDGVTVEEVALFDPEAGAAEAGAAEVAPAPQAPPRRPAAMPSGTAAIAMDQPRAGIVEREPETRVEIAPAERPKRVEIGRQDTARRDQLAKEISGAAGDDSEWLGESFRQALFSEISGEQYEPGSPAAMPAAPAQAASQAASAPQAARPVARLPEPPLVLPEEDDALVFPPEPEIGVPYEQSTPMRGRSAMQSGASVDERPPVDLDALMEGAEIFDLPADAIVASPKAAPAPTSEEPPVGLPDEAAAAEQPVALDQEVAPSVSGGLELAIAMQPAAAPGVSEDVPVEGMALFDPNAGMPDASLPDAGGAETALAMAAAPPGMGEDVPVEEMALFDPNEGGPKEAGPETASVMEAAPAEDVPVEEMALFDPNAGGADVALALQSGEWPATPTLEIPPAPARDAAQAQPTQLAPARLPVQPAKPVRSKLTPQLAADLSDETMLPLPSASRNDRGRPRFFMPIQRRHFKDPDIIALCRQEADAGGYRYGARRFLDEHMLPGDVLIDVGAHWGVFSLTAATRWPDEVDVLAIEPEPANLARLRHWVEANHLAGRIDVVAAAAGGREGTALFRRESSMRHGFLRMHDEAGGPADFEAPMTRLDTLLAARPELQGRRVFLKIDTEGLEPDVIAGVPELIDSGRVAAIIWSRGRRYDREQERNRLGKLVDALSAKGFRHFRLPHDVLGGALIPFVYGHELCVVFSLSPGFKAQTSYARPPGTWIAPPRPSSVTLPQPARIAWTELLMHSKGTDGGRWADASTLEPGAEARAAAAAAFIPANSHVVDLGAGSMALAAELEGSAIVQPVDLVARADNAIVCDLNQDRWPDSPPEGYYDVVALLHVLEYLHDPAAALKRCRDLSGRMVFSYRHPIDAAAEREARRAEGVFNDLSVDELRVALKAAGWLVSDEKDLGADRLYSCKAA